MADFVFNIAKGAAAEMARDDATKFGVLLLTTSPSDATMKDFATLATLLAGGAVEATFTDYARKTGITATLTVDTTNDRVDIDMADQTWTGAGGASNQTTTDAIIFYENSAADSGRIPIVCLDFVATTSDNDLTMQLNASGFFRAS